MITFDEFPEVFAEIKRGLTIAPIVHPPRWQSMDVSQNEAMSTHELLHYSFALALPTESLDYYRETILPNLPWVDDHFSKERVGGDPLNPGTEWRNWPWAKSADKHRREGAEDPQFDHSYAERYWPKHAGQTKGGILFPFYADDDEMPALEGIRFKYGDLDDLVTILANEKLTRQAYLPIWFPEDLGACIEKKRVPCSLGYHFIAREDKIDLVYYIRSCDFYKHFRDDVYMTIRLLLWVLEQCRLANPAGDWEQVKPGRLIMHTTSMHIFMGDAKVLFKTAKKEKT